MMTTEEVMAIMQKNTEIEISSGYFEELRELGSDNRVVYARTGSWEARATIYLDSKKRSIEVRGHTFGDMVNRLWEDWKELTHYSS